jgi:hypothetical protein
MGVSGNDMGTLEGKSSKASLHGAFGTVNQLDAKMVFADGVCDPEPRQRRSGDELVACVGGGSPDWPGSMEATK